MLHCCGIRPPDSICWLTSGLHERCAHFLIRSHCMLVVSLASNRNGRQAVTIRFHGVFTTTYEMKHGFYVLVIHKSALLTTFAYLLHQATTEISLWLEFVNATSPDVSSASRSTTTMFGRESSCKSSTQLSKRRSYEP